MAVLLRVIRFEYPHANDAIIERQRRCDSHRLVGGTATLDRWPDILPVLPKARFVTRSGGRRQHRATLSRCGFALASALAPRSSSP